MDHLLLPVCADGTFQLHPRPLGQPSKLSNVGCEDAVGIALNKFGLFGDDVESTSVNDQWQVPLTSVVDYACNGWLNLQQHGKHVLLTVGASGFEWDTDIV